MITATGTARAAFASRASGGRAPALALLPAGIVAGFGLGLVALALLAPAPDIPPLPAISDVASTPAPGVAGPGLDPEPETGWAPLFGTLPETPVETPVAAEPEPVAPPPDPRESVDLSTIRLRGLIVNDAEGDAFALVEGRNGIEIFRQGDILPDGFEILAVTRDGLVIDVFGEQAIIDFAENAGPVDVSRYEEPRPRLERRPPGGSRSIDLTEPPGEGAPGGDPFGRDRRDPFGRGESYGRDPYTQDPYAGDPYQQDPYAQDPYMQDPYAQEPYTQDPYAQDPGDPSYGGPGGPGGETYGGFPDAGPSQPPDSRLMGIGR